MKPICQCGKPTEAERYKYCYNCWWDQDPRNPLNLDKLNPPSSDTVRIRSLERDVKHLKNVIRYTKSQLACLANGVGNPEEYALDILQTMDLGQHNK